MVFNSVQYLIFFPVVACIHFMLPHRARWLWLLAASLYFYGLFEPLFLLQILAATACTFYLALRIEAAEDKAGKKAILILALVLLVANLFLFKYTSFFNETFRTIFGWLDLTYPVPVFHILLPVGISFYTFQLISYVVDVFRGAKAERHFGIFALYVSFFPKLISGPIERAKNLLPQLHAEQHFDYGQVVFGLQLMAWGMFKKVVVADRLAPYVQQAYANPQAYDGVALTLATVAFAFQVYCDFSGYTDMARGAAHAMGYRLMDNFNRPYFATSIQDFWKRWHISLTSWLTDYVYTPLTRTRAIKMKWYYLMLISLFVTFLVSGLWHGAQWTYVAWGALHGSYLIASVLTQGVRGKLVRFARLGKVPRLHRALRIAMTFSLVCFAYILFRAASLTDAVYIATHLHTGWSDPSIGARALIGLRWPELLLAVCGVSIVMIVEAFQGSAAALAARPVWIRWSVYYAGALSIVVLGAYYDTDQKFIYFQF